MSHTPSNARRLSITDLQAMKGQQKIVSLTAYSAYMAEILDPNIDLFIVGDSLGMVLYGMESTLPVTLDLMIRHGRVVVDSSSHACVLVDLPFGSYQQSPEQAFESAARLVQETGCQLVKLEGGMEMLETVRFLCERGIPVMPHIGLKPQHVNSMGGYKYQGRSDEDAQQLLQQAKAFEAAGACGLLLEGTKESVARQITEALSIPTIGIGASPACDGQVLVSEDMLGYHTHTPSFVKTYTSLREATEGAVKQYAEEVRNETFPTDKHCFGMAKKVSS